MPIYEGGVKQMNPTKADVFLQLVAYMRDQYGINLEQKRTLVEGRLSSYITQQGFKSLEDYFRHVQSDKSGQEAKMLVTRLTTNYTYFMREEQHYKFLSQTVLPQLVSTLSAKDMRIWSAGSSSGEEAYTTAMLIDDYFGGHKNGWDTKILATDISPSVLKQALTGVYPADRLQNVSEVWKERYFIKLPDGHYEVISRLKEEVIFRSFNLMEPHFPFKKKFHVIFCRNVMIYFNKPTREALISKFYQAIEPGGYLFIGLSETISKGDSPFTFVSPSIYRKEG